MSEASVTRIKGIDNMTLLAYRCQCGHLNVLGFFQQCTVSVDPERKVATVWATCRECGLMYTRGYPITTSRRYPLINWGRALVFVWRWLPRRLIRPAITLTFWLKKRVRL